MGRHSKNSFYVFKICVIYILVYQNQYAVSSSMHMTSTIKKGSNGMYSDLISPEFPGKQSLSKKVYTYLIENTDVGYVRIIFSDFHIYSGNSLKIYDGKFTEGTVQVYSNTTRPVFQSSGSSLYMVYKVSGGHTANYIGWKAKVYFVSESRDSWITIPSTGLCPPVLSSTGVLIDTSKFSVPPNVDCVWTVKNSGDMYLVALLPTAARNDSVHLSVRYGNSSEGQAVAPSYTISSNVTYMVYWLRNEFYVQLKGVFMKGSQFRMAYRETQVQAQESVSSLQSLVTNYPCQFKDCNMLYSMSLGEQNRCETYWGTCDKSSLYSDPSCDLWDYVQCNKVINGHISCYSSSTDVCDDFVDCSDGKDENNCASKTWSQLLSSAMVIIGVIILLFVIFNTNDIKKRCRSAKLFVWMKKCCCDCIIFTKEPIKASWNAKYLGFLTLSIAVIFILGVVFGEGYVNQTLCKGGRAWCEQCRHDYRQTLVRREQQLRRGSRVRVVPASSTRGQHAQNSNTDNSTDRTESSYTVQPSAFTSISRTASVSVISDNFLAPPAYTEVDPNSQPSRRGSSNSVLSVTAVQPPAYSSSGNSNEHLEHPASPPPAYEEAVQQSSV